MGKENSHKDSDYGSKRAPVPQEYSFCSKIHSRRLCIQSTEAVFFLFFFFSFFSFFGLATLNEKQITFTNCSA